MATYYIATTGNDTTGDGSSGSPWATMTKAYNSSSQGDTVNIAAGTYDWEYGDLDGRIWQGDDATTTIIDANGGADPDSGTIGIGIGNSGEFNDLTFTGLNETYVGTYGVSAFHNATQNGTIGGSTTFAFKNCIFHDIEILTSGTGGLIIFGDGTTGGGNHQGGAIDLTIQSCLFYDIRLTGVEKSLVYSGTFGTSSPTKKLMMYNNVIYNDASSTERINNLYNLSTNHMDEAITKNNIIYNASGGTMTYVFSGGTNTSSNNCFYQMTSSPSGTGNITTDPQFVDAANRDFRLRQSSPCIDAGTVI